MTGLDLLELAAWANADALLRGAEVRPEGARRVRAPKTDAEIAVVLMVLINQACARNGLPPFVTASVGD